jgi:hypothetical protein
VCLHVLGGRSWGGIYKFNELRKIRPKSGLILTVFHLRLSNAGAQLIFRGGFLARLSKILPLFDGKGFIATYSHIHNPFILISPTDTSAEESA